MPGRTLVTGAAGLIGRHVLGPLGAAGAAVHAVSRSVPAEAAPGVVWHRCDLLDGAARAALIAEVRPQTIVHLAWETTHGRFWDDPANAAWLAATLELAALAGERGLARFVGVGTCFEYAGDVVGDCDEALTPLAPTRAYGRAKRDAFLALTDGAAGAGVSLAWARLFMLYGPGEDPRRLVPDVARRLISGEEAPISSGRALRDFMDTRDAGSALAALAMSGVEGPVNVASGEAVSVRHVAETLGRLAGRPDLIRVGARPDRDEPPRLVAATGRLSGEVGWNGVRPLDDGLSAALDYWRSVMNPSGAMKTA